MEFRIKTSGVCDFTGKQSGPLVKIVSDDEQISSGWLCAELLREALNMVRPQQQPQAIQYQMPSVPSFTNLPYIVQNIECKEEVVQAVAAERPTKSDNKMAESDRVLLEAFFNDCRELAENPPADHRGNASSTVGESEIKKRMAIWAPRFKNKKVMAPILNQFFGMPEERFEILLTLVK